jgi:hypothetical protein
LASVKEQAQRIGAPRTLFCEFPLGRPLGKPADAEFQSGVVRAAFDMLDASSGPVWHEYPVVVSDDAEEQVSCALPPRFDPNELPAVDEARAIQAAYERTVAANGGRTNFGRVLTHETVLDALRALDQIANHGVAWEQAGLPADSIQTTIDIRAYYIEAATSLTTNSVNPSGSAWGVERWFYTQTEAGRLLIAARAAMKEAGAPHPVWFYMSSMDQ